MIFQTIFLIYFSSELEEVYEQFSRWLENPLLETDKGMNRELDARELAVVRFAGDYFVDIDAYRK